MKFPNKKEFKMIEEYYEDIANTGVNMSKIYDTLFKSLTMFVVAYNVVRMVY